MRLPRNIFHDIADRCGMAVEKARNGFINGTGMLFGTIAVLTMAYFAITAFIRNAVFAAVAVIFGVPIVNNFLRPESQIDTVNVLQTAANVVRTQGFAAAQRAKPLIHTTIYTPASMVGETAAKLVLSGADSACNSAYKNVTGAASYMCQSAADTASSIRSTIRSRFW